MEELGVQILQQIAGNSPVILLMGIIIYVLYKKVNKLEDEKKELQTQIRESEKENIETLKDIDATLETLIETERNNKEQIITRIDDRVNTLKDSIDLKLQMLNDKIK